MRKKTLGLVLVGVALGAVIVTLTLGHLATGAIGDAFGHLVDFSVDAGP